MHAVVSATGGLENAGSKRGDVGRAYRDEQMDASNQTIKPLYDLPSEERKKITDRMSVLREPLVSKLREKLKNIAKHLVRGFGDLIIVLDRTG